MNSPVGRDQRVTLLDVYLIVLIHGAGDLVAEMGGGQGREIQNTGILSFSQNERLKRAKTKYRGPSLLSG
jgi:hypothetical protein